jgi:multimeric flavodoxin WrbA
MNVLAIAGSPRRHGNTNTLARRFLETAAKRGATTRFVYLNGLQHVHGCAACNACKKRSDRCVLRDDLRTVLDAIERADVVIYASPVYFGDLSGQMKLCFDRHYSFFTSDFACRLKPGKKGLMILAQGGEADEYDDVFPRYRAFLKPSMRFGDVRLVRLCGADGPEAVQSRKGLLSKVDAIAEAWVVSAGGKARRVTARSRRSPSTAPPCRPTQPARPSPTGRASCLAPWRGAPA